MSALPGTTIVRTRHWPLAPGDGFQLVAIVLAAALGALAAALLAAAA